MRDAARPSDVRGIVVERWRLDVNDKRSSRLGPPTKIPSQAAVGHTGRLPEASKGRAAKRQ